MKKKLVLLTVVAVVAALSLSVLLTGCTDFSKATPDDIQKYGKLVIATSANFPPFESKEGEKIVGWDIDVANALAKKLGVELEIRDMEFDAVLSSVATGKVHIGMAGISNTAKRDEVVDFSMDVFESSQMIIVRADETEITEPKDLEGKIVSYQAGTIGDYLANMNKDYAYHFDDNGDPILDSPLLGTPKEVIPASDGTTAILNVINGKADAVILDKLPAETIVKNLNTDGVKVKILEKSIYDDAYAFAIGEGNTELKKWINQAYTELIEDGTIEALNDKWFGSSAE